ncbi:MAG: hypothetical protein IT307_09135 [Chloroflexi bacterium]|nr:hypothetical protein [Chloroflexota bacterium]
MKNGRRHAGLQGSVVWLLAALALPLWPLGVAAQPTPVPRITQDACPERNDGFATACKIGAPDANGTTLKGGLQQPGDIDAYEFQVQRPSSVHIVLADLWIDTDISLYETATGRFIGQARFVAESRRTGQDQGQFQAPEFIVERLEPGAYTIFVFSGDLLAYDLRGYTARVALGAPTVAQPLPPAGQEPTWRKDNYVLSLGMEPADATQFSLMTFTAFIDPPFTDLFDFAWEIDGKPLPDSNMPVIQMGRPSLGRHTVKLTAVGARDYPDPDHPHRPPTLSAVGAFEVRQTQ